jgi:hypothetical protein
VSLRKRFIAILATVAAATASLTGVGATADAANNPPVTGAAFTTTNTAVDGTGHCQNGNEDVNCNIYDGKQYVWMNGGPNTAYVGDGSYFFTVMAPGGQADPNDGSAKNLSDTYDAYTNRTFSVTNGTVSYTGTHDFANNKIRLADYADTPNPGGVYILAICSLDKGYPVTASRCKYDAFKIKPPVDAKPLTVTKDANGSYDSAYTWQISKNADKTVAKQVSGNVTFGYNVTVTKSPAVNTNIKVTGTITVFNPNADPVSGVDVTDQLSDGTNCTVTNGANQTVTTGDNTYAYSCSLSSLPQGQLDNTVVAAWPAQSLADGSVLTDSSANFTFTKIVFTQHTVTNNCVSVTDKFNGGTPASLGTVCDTTSFPYSQTVPVPAFGYTECVSYSNTATVTTDTTQTTGSASKTVKVCGAMKTGARPMLFWKNATGKTIITGSAATGTVCNAGVWLGSHAPFQTLPANATCAQVYTAVSATVTAANLAGSTTAARLKGNALATALDVYFSDPALGGNQLATKKPVGSYPVDTTVVCHMTDPTGAAGACTGIYNDASAAFGAASLTVLQLLDATSTQVDAGGANWYGNDANLQVLAKDTFSAINNQKAFRG